MSKKVIGAVIGALLLVVVVAGCGSSDTSTTALTKDEFIAQADQICAAGNTEINAAFGELGQGGKPSADEISTVVTEKVLPSIQSQVDQVRALTPPSGDEDQISAILDTVQGAIDSSKADPTLLAGNADPFAEGNQMAQDYGLKECGQG